MLGLDGLSSGRHATRSRNTMTEAEPSRTQPYKRLSVIVPVFNERNTVAEIARRMRRVNLPLDVDIVMVDDGSWDGTSDVLKAIEDSTINVVRHVANQGKGAAIRTGMAHARGDIILIQDADLEYDPDDWPRMVDPLLKGKAQVVYGSRFTGERRVTRLTQWLGNQALSLVTNVLYNTTLSDIETGYKAFDRRVLESIAIQADGFEVEPEITAKILRKRYRIYEVPISYSSRDPYEGKKFTWKDGLYSLLTLVRCRFERLP